MSLSTHSTQNDVALDVVAALDMYSGTFGGEYTTIDKVGEGQTDSVIVTLSNGDEYELRVRLLREGAAA